MNRCFSFGLISKIVSKKSHNIISTWSKKLPSITVRKKWKNNCYHRKETKTFEVLERCKNNSLMNRYLCEIRKEIGKLLIAECKFFTCM